jgi:hypothetical protein
VGKVLDDSEVDLFDCINQDLVELAGTDINYYAHDTSAIKNRRKVDPLYGEPTERTFEGPHRVAAWVKYPQYEPLAEEVGFGREWDAEVVISRASLDEKNLPYPSEADIIEMWRTPYHDRWSMGKGMFFDVIKAEHDGHINDSPTFTQFRLKIKRRSQFGAERRITPP